MRAFSLHSFLLICIMFYHFFIAMGTFFYHVLQRGMGERLFAFCEKCVQGVDWLFLERDITFLPAFYLAHLASN